VEYTTQPAADSTVFKLSGRLTFKDHSKIADIKHVLSQTSGSQHFVIDLSEVEFIDSSGLGSLIAFKEAVADHNTPVILRHPQDKVLKIFKACCYDELFTIED